MQVNAIINLIVAVLANVVSDYICKWFDSKK